MRYKVVFYPMLDQTLAVVTSMRDSAWGANVVTTRNLLKTYGSDWDLEQLLRELADQVGESRAQDSLA